MRITFIEFILSRRRKKLTETRTFPLTARKFRVLSRQTPVVVNDGSFRSRPSAPDTERRRRRRRRARGVSGVRGRDALLLAAGLLAVAKFLADTCKQ